MTALPTEGFLPVLSAGRHRSAKRGACFMEYASYLAGERWSDRPACTHPSLASLARLVNDLTSDGARGSLSRLIPSVVGLAGASSNLAAWYTNEPNGTPPEARRRFFEFFFCSRRALATASLTASAALLRLTFAFTPCVPNGAVIVATRLFALSTSAPSSCSSVRNLRNVDLAT